MANVFSVWDMYGNVLSSHSSASEASKAAKAFSESIPCLSGWDQPASQQCACPDEDGQYCSDASLGCPNSCECSLTPVTCVFEMT